MTSRPIDGVVFDLDGVLVDSEHLWEEAWSSCAAQAGVDWRAEDTAAVQGMSVPEWSGYVAGRIGTEHQRGLLPVEVARYCVDLFIERIVTDGEGDLLPGARNLVESVSTQVPVALASSAARKAIEAILAHHRLTPRFTATVSSEEVDRGKPNPDVYLEAVRRLGLPPERCAAVEDSTNGILAAHRAGLHVLVTPNAHYPPQPHALAYASFIAADAAAATRYLTPMLSRRSQR